MKILKLEKLAAGLSVGALVVQIIFRGLSLDAVIFALSYSLGVILMAGHLERMRIADASYCPSLNEPETRFETLALWIAAIGLMLLLPMLLGDSLGRCLARAGLGAAGLFTVNAALPTVINR